MVYSLSAPCVDVIWDPSFGFLCGFLRQTHSVGCAEFSALLMFFSGNDPFDAVQRVPRAMGVDVLPVLQVIVLLRALGRAPSQADGCAQPPANPALAPTPDHLPAQCRRLAD